MDKNRWERAATQFSDKQISIGRNQDFEKRIKTIAVPGENSVQPKDQKVNTVIKKQDDFEDLAVRRRKQETIDKFRTRIIAQQEQKLDKRLAILGRIRDRAPV